MVGIEAKLPKAMVEATAQDAGGNGKADKEDYKKSYRVMKYSGGGILHEAVLLGGLPYFASWHDRILELKEEIEESNRILKPFTESEPKPYSFANNNELRQYLARARHEDLDSLWSKVRSTVAAFNATDDRYIEILTADIIFSHFADKIGGTHYLWPHGRSGTGKGSMLETAHQLAYRAALVSNTTAANVYRLLGSIEIGQCSLLIDEANNLENDPFLMEVLKTGYKANGKVPRIMDASSSDAEQVFYHTFCWKMIAAEKLPPVWKAEGLLNRCFLIKTYPAEPKFKIDKAVNPAGDPLLQKLNAQLNSLRKLLFAYRLLHYDAPILDVKLTIDGRDEELCSPLVRLFRKSKVLDTTIIPTLYEFVKEKREANSQSLDQKILDVVRDIINAQPANDKNYKLEFSAIWATLKDATQGELSADKPQSMMTRAFGEVTFKAVSQVLMKFGAKRGKNAQGNRILEFDQRRLDQFATLYLIPDKLAIKDSPDTSGTSGTLWEDLQEYGVQNNSNPDVQSTDISKSNI